MSSSLSEDKGPYEVLQENMQPAAGTTTVAYKPQDKNANYCFKYTVTDQAGNETPLESGTEICRALVPSMAISFKVSPTTFGIHVSPSSEWPNGLTGFTFGYALCTSYCNINASQLLNGTLPSTTPGLAIKAVSNSPSFLFEKGISPNTIYYYVLVYRHWSSMAMQLNYQAPITTPPLPGSNTVATNNPPNFDPYSVKLTPSVNSINASWRAATDPDGDALTYQVYHSQLSFTVLNLGAKYVTMKAGTPTGLNITGLSPNTTYYVLVTVTDAKGAVVYKTNAAIKMTKTL